MFDCIDEKFFRCPRVVTMMNPEAGQAQGRLVVVRSRGVDRDGTALMVGGAALIGAFR